MKRSEQARMLIGLTIPGGGPVARPAATPQAAVPLARRWLDAMGRQRRAESRSRTDSLEGIRVAYFLVLFACGILFGLFVGGYVGYVDGSAPPADSPYGLGQLATSDVQWTAMMRQYSVLHRPHEAAPESVQEPFWQHLAGGAAAAGDDRSIRLDASGSRSVVTR